MPILVLDPQPTAIEEMLHERARLDLDRRDEVWEGVLHVIPPPSHAHERLAVKLATLLDPLADAAGLELTGPVGIGAGPENYRVPDLVLHRPGAPDQWHPTAALVIEILSPGDTAWDKRPFYAAHHIDELLIIDPPEHAVHWLALQDGEYLPVEHSQLIDLSPITLAEHIDWPELP